ncbi:MAG: ATP-binding protein [Candidatus Thorarchaeota archaeon]
MTSLLDGLETTAQVETPSDPFQRIIGQEHAVSIVRSAVKQHRHVLLCGVPGIGKSMLAKAAYTLLEEPKEEIRLRYNPSQPDRPDVVVRRPSQLDATTEQSGVVNVLDTIYATPDRIPFDISIKMGFRCPACGSISTPEESSCAECGVEKRFDWTHGESYHGLFRMLDVVREPALKTVTNLEDIGGRSYQVTYEHTNQGEITITRKGSGAQMDHPSHDTNHEERILVPHNSTRFIRVSGASPVELLGDVKHDPYGSAESLGLAAHHRVVPGAIHEAHEGILYIDEIAALGSYQSHLLTAMQDRVFSISGHNPLSSGAAVRVDDVPCDFILFASSNVENLVNILAPLRSRIRGYGYEVMLDSWILKSEKTCNDIVRFVSQTVEEDGRIPHMTANSLEIVLEIAEKMAYQLDEVKDAFTLRLRELGGLIRIAGDLAVHDECEFVKPEHVNRATVLTRGISDETQYYQGQKTEPSISKDYFF